jgi:hypothetical protein
MDFNLVTIRKTINKAFLKEPIQRDSFTLFKDALEQLIDVIDVAKDKKEHELRHQDEVDEVDVAVLDPNINHCLGEKREDKLQNTSGQQAERQLEQKVFIGQNVPEQDAKTKAVARFSLQILKRRCSLQ